MFFGHQTLVERKVSACFMFLLFCQELSILVNNNVRTINNEITTHDLNYCELIMKR